MEKVLYGWHDCIMRAGCRGRRRRGASVKKPQREEESMQASGIDIISGKGSQLKKVAAGPRRRRAWNLRELRNSSVIIGNNGPGKRRPWAQPVGGRKEEAMP